MVDIQMFFLIWQGWGLLGLIIPVIVVFTGAFTVDFFMGNGYSNSHWLIVPIMLVLSAIIIWFIGVKLNNSPAKKIVNSKTNQTFLIKKKHALFWIPLQYFSLIILGFAIYIAIY